MRLWYFGQFLVWGRDIIHNTWRSGFFFISFVSFGVLLLRLLPDFWNACMSPTDIDQLGADQRINENTSGWQQAMTARFRKPSDLFGDRDKLIRLTFVNVATMAFDRFYVGCSCVMQVRGGGKERVGHPFLYHLLMDGGHKLVIWVLFEFSSWLRGGSFGTISGEFGNHMLLLSLLWLNACGKGRGKSPDQLRRFWVQCSFIAFCMVGHLFAQLTSVAV